jgi:hypothetical protein
VHDSWHGPNSQPDKRNSAQRHAVRTRVDHVCPRTCAQGSTVVPHRPMRERTSAPLRALRRLLHATEPACACVRACVTWLGGGLTARHSVESVRRRHKVTGAERSLRCIVCRRRLNLRKPTHAPRQAVRSSVHEAGRRPLRMGTTACSAETVLELYPTRNLPHYSAVGWHACNDEKRGPCIVLHQHARSTSDVQKTLCRQRAGHHWGYSRVLKGTRLLDGMRASRRNTDHAPCGMNGTRPTSDAQQPSCRRCTEGF